MKYKEIEKLEGEEFWRLTGVKKATFELMVGNMIFGCLENQG